MSTIERTIRQFVIDNFFFGEENQEFHNENSLIEKGVIDSMGMLGLISFVQETYGIKVEDQELVPENWDSVSRIASFVQSKNNLRS
jgi:acyl carrier protein